MSNSIAIHENEAVEASVALMRRAAELDCPCEAATLRKVAYFLRNASVSAKQKEHNMVDVVAQSFDHDTWTKAQRKAQFA